MSRAKQHITEDFDRMVRAARELEDEGSIPFVSLAVNIQQDKHNKCWLSLKESDEYPAQALCLTKIVEFGYRDSGKRFYLPHHLIIVRPGKIDDVSRRFGVAHEIGHVVLHFSRYFRDLISGDSAKLKIGEHGEIQYETDEEIEASIFAGVLCRRRPPLGKRPPIPLEDLLKEVEQASRSYNISEETVKRIVDGLRNACESLSEEEDEEQDK